MAIIPYSPAIPAEYTLAYNDQVYVWRTTINSPTIRFRVLVMPQFGLTPIATMIIYPIPTENQTGNSTRGFVDISRILQSTLGHDVDIPTANHLGFFQNDNSHLEYYLIVQEQDISPITGAYVILEGWNIYDAKSVWNGIQNLVEWKDFAPSDYLMTVGVAATKFLSAAPTTREINSGQSAFLYLIATENQAPAVYRLQTFDGFNGTGSALNNATVADPYATTFDSSYDRQYLRMPVGTYDIPLIASSAMTGATPSTVLNNAKSYTIRLEDNVGVGQVISETITFNIDQNCSKFTPIRIHWMNRLGGFDSFNFDLKNLESTNVKRKDFRQQYHTWAGATASSTTWDYTKSNRGRKTYDTQLTKKLTVNTNYLTEAESVWMEDLFTSPEIYQEINNELIAANINGNSIQKKTGLNDKVLQYTFDLEFSLLNGRQRG